MVGRAVVTVVGTFVVVVVVVAGRTVVVVFGAVAGAMVVVGAVSGVCSTCGAGVEVDGPMDDSAADGSLRCNTPAPATTATSRAHATMSR